MEDTRYGCGCLFDYPALGEVFAEHAPPLLDANVPIRFSIRVVNPCTILMDLLTKILILRLIPVSIEVFSTEDWICHSGYDWTRLQPGVKPSKKCLQSG